MNDSITFYTRNLKPGEIARFDITTTVYGWQHVLRGCIIQSQEDGKPSVVWPRGSARYYPHTPVQGYTPQAEAAILKMFGDWCAQ